MYKKVKKFEEGKLVKFDVFTAPVIKYNDIF